MSVRACTTPLVTISVVSSSASSVRSVRSASTRAARTISRAAPGVRRSAGNLIRIVIHWEHHSNDTNSVTGLTLHEHGHYTETIDLLAGTDTLTGNQEIMNRPGTGVVIQDVGRVVYDADGNLVFFAGGRKHSEELLGDQVLCQALA